MDFPGRKVIGELERFDGLPDITELKRIGQVGDKDLGFWCGIEYLVGDDIIPECQQHSTMSDGHHYAGTLRVLSADSIISMQRHIKDSHIFLYVTPNNQVLFVYIEGETYNIVAKMTLAELYRTMYQQPSSNPEDEKWVRISTVVEQSDQSEKCAFDHTLTCDFPESDHCVFRHLKRNEGKIRDESREITVLAYNPSEKLFMILLNRRLVLDCSLPVVFVDADGVEYSVAYMHRSWIERSSINIRLGQFDLSV